MGMFLTLAEINLLSIQISLIHLKQIFCVKGTDLVTIYGCESLLNVRSNLNNRDPTV